MGGGGVKNPENFLDVLCLMYFAPFLYLYPLVSKRNTSNKVGACLAIQYWVGIRVLQSTLKRPHLSQQRNVDGGGAISFSNAKARRT